MALSEQEQMMIEQARAQIDAANIQNQQLQNQTNQQASFMEQQDKGMAEAQLDLSDDIERIEHLLRGHIIKRDENGIEYWDAPQDDRMKLLNEYGVRLLMKTITFYLSRRKLLSNYSEDQINEKMYDFVEDLSDLIFMKYREIGLDTPDKRKCYPILVREIQDAVHDIYLRALAGKERDSIRKHWNINEQAGNLLGNPNQGGKTINPRTWLR